MAASHPLSVRLDDEAAAALRELEAQGMSRSQAVRSSLVLAAAQRRTRQALRAEARALADDERDVELMSKVREEMEDLSAPW